MFPNATVSSRSSSSRSANSCSRNSSMPSLRMPNPLLPKTSFNPLFRNTDAFTSFDASNFVFHESKRLKKEKQPILRRFNSHESHTNFIDIRAESNTSHSNKSRTEDGLPTPSVSPNSTEERNRRPQYEARDFLEKYSLPRIVRVEDGEPLLLYRCFDSFTKVQARGIVGKKGKEKADLNTLHFPEGYPGWFSLTNEKGEKAAVAHSSVLQLVREQVCSFISIQSFTAYTAGNQESSDGMNSRSQYLKTQIRGGQVFQLRAVFQHQDRSSEGGKHSTRSSRISRSARDKDLANRYAQLTSQNNQELYVPLTTKGEFYEIYSTMKARLCFPGLIDKTGPLALDKDCLYKLTHLLRRMALPVKVKLLSGSLPPGVPKEFTDSFILEKKIQEPLMVTCTLPPPSEDIKHVISCINLNSRVKISKCTLGFDSESRLFKSQRVQSTLAFCHKNVDNWYREVRLIPNIHLEVLHQTPHLTCTECRKLNKVCTDNCPTKQSEENNPKQLITKQVIDKFPKSKKWYRHFKILGLGGEHNGKFEDMKDPMDGIEKGKSIERYKDMSKLIEDKFGKKSYNPVKKSASFMYSNKRMDLQETPTDKKGNPALLKCQSLDTQIYSNEDDHQLKLLKEKLHRKISNASETLSVDFEMCILENEGGIINRGKNSVRQGHSLKDLTTNLHITKINFDEIKPVEDIAKMKKTKPDLIPTLPKNDDTSSYITDRLCSEFHVKTKMQKRSGSKLNLLASSDNFRSSVRIIESIKGRHFSVFDAKKSINTQSVVVQVHEESLPKTKSHKMTSVIVDEIPYSHVMDEVRERANGKQDENIYAEICENSCNCDSMPKCDCKRTKKANSEYCYVKLGSNGDSVIQSDSDEAIYNTLR